MSSLFRSIDSYPDQINACGAMARLLDGLGNFSMVAAAMRNLVEQFPALEQHLYNGNGEMRAFVNLFLGENNTRDLQGFETPLSEGDTLRIIPSIAGG